MPELLTITDFRRGVVSSLENPLIQPANSIRDGNNLDLTSGAIQTRRGGRYYSQRTVASNPLPDGTVQFLGQIRIPRVEKTFLLAQVDTGSANKLYVSKDQIPVTDGTGDWTEIYDLGAGAGTVSLAQLGNRAVITEGVVDGPLVFLGCQETDGTDWATPISVLVNWDVSDGEGLDNATQELCDTDADTTYALNSLPYNADNDLTGSIYVCCDVPKVSGFWLSVGDTNSATETMVVEGMASGSWGTVSSLSDGTASGGASLAQSGVVTFTEYTTDYQSIGNVSGYWFRISFTGALDASVSLKETRFKAACQPLKTIGSGVPEAPLAFLYWDSTKVSAKDYTVDVQDFTMPTAAYLDDGLLASPEAMTTSDYIYIAHSLPFNAVKITMHNDYNNQNASTLSGYYWDGDSWVDASITDGTKSSGGTKCLSQTGTITFSTPSAWKRNRAINHSYPLGYYLRLQVSATLTASSDGERTAISECAIYPDYEALDKHKEVFRFRDRLVMAVTPAGHDQVDISRRTEEYGWCGTDSWTTRMGGQDTIRAVAEGYNQAWLFQPTDCFIMNGYDPQTFSFERAEIANQTPINSRVIVRGPNLTARSDDRMGFYFINESGAFYYSGMNLLDISEEVNWWNTDDDLRIDTDNLQTSCGAYYPDKAWVVWAVPVGTNQTTNNRLIVYDVRQGIWLPPFDRAVASLASAFEYNASAVGLLGKERFFAGDYSGNVIELFDYSLTTDAGGTAIASSATTGWLSLDSPNWENRITKIRLFGKTAAASITLTVYTDGTTGSSDTRTFSRIASLGAAQLFAIDYVDRENIKGTFFQFKLDTTADTQVYGLQVEYEALRKDLADSAS